MNYESESTSVTKLIIRDLFKSFKVSWIIYLISTMFGIIFGSIYAATTEFQFSFYNILRFIEASGVWTACLGLAISGIAFMKPKTMEPLSFQKQWRRYYKKFNLIGAILSISVYVLIYSMALNIMLWSFMN